MIAASTTKSKVAPTGPRPLSPEDPIFRKALELLKTPAQESGLAAGDLAGTVAIS